MSEKEHIMSDELQSEILNEINTKLEGILINRVEIKSEFILVGNLFINMGVVTDCYIDSGIIKLSQMGGSYLIIGNNDAEFLDPNQPFAVMLDEPYYVALTAYLKDRFQAKEIKPDQWDDHQKRKDI